MKTLISHNRAFAAFACMGTLLFAICLIESVDASVTWPILAVGGAAAVAAILWMPDPKAALLFVFLMTLPMEITKALTSETSTNGAALSLHLSDLSFAPLVVVWFVDKIRKRAKVHWTRLHSIGLILLIWLSISSMMSIDPSGRLVNTNNVKYFLYFIIVADLVTNPFYLRVSLMAAGIGLAAQIVMTALQLLTGSELHILGSKDTLLGQELVFEQGGGLHFVRPSGFLSHPNMFADYLTFVLPPLIAVVLLGRRTIGTLTWYVLSVLCIGALVCLVASLSRGGWVAFAVAIVFVMIVGYSCGFVKRKHLTAFAVTGAVLGVIISAIFPEAIYRIVLSDDQSSHARIAMMEQAELIIEEHPIVGVGLGGYNKEAQKEIPATWSGLSVGFRDILLKGVVHNKYLLTFAETGIIGLLLFLWFLFGAVSMIFRRVAWRLPEQAALAVGLTGSIVAQIIFYLFDHFSYDTRLAMLYVAAGLLSGTLYPLSSEIESSWPARLLAQPISIGRIPST